MGESPSKVLTAKAIYHGFNEHFCVMTDAQSTSVLRSLQTRWLEGQQLSRHALAHGAARAQLVAGGKAPSEEQSKKALWLSFEELRSMALYSVRPGRYHGQPLCWEPKASHIKSVPRIVCHSVFKQHT